MATPVEREESNSWPKQFLLQEIVMVNIITMILRAIFTVDCLDVILEAKDSKCHRARKYHQTDWAAGDLIGYHTFCCSHTVVIHSPLTVTLWNRELTLVNGLKWFLCISIDQIMSENLRGEPHNLFTMHYSHKMTRKTAPCLLSTATCNYVHVSPSHLVSPGWPRRDWLPLRTLWPHSSHASYQTRKGIKALLALMPYRVWHFMMNRACEGSQL